MTEDDREQLRIRISMFVLGHLMAPDGYLEQDKTWLATQAVQQADQLLFALGINYGPRKEGQQQ